MRVCMATVHGLEIAAHTTVGELRGQVNKCGQLKGS